MTMTLTEYASRLFSSGTEQNPETQQIQESTEDTVEELEPSPHEDGDMVSRFIDEEITEPLPEGPHEDGDMVSRFIDEEVNQPDSYDEHLEDMCSTGFRSKGVYHPSAGGFLDQDSVVQLAGELTSYVQATEETIEVDVDGVRDTYTDRCAELEQVSNGEWTPEELDSFDKGEGDGPYRMASNEVGMALGIAIAEEESEQDMQGAVSYSDIADGLVADFGDDSDYKRNFEKDRVNELEHMMRKGNSGQHQAYEMAEKGIIGDTEIS